MVNSRLHIRVSYFLHSTAIGAFIIFVAIDQNFEIHSMHFTLDRYSKENYVLPINLEPEQYDVFVYDIEHDGTLRDGVNYPAARDKVLITTSTTSKAVFCVVHVINDVL